MRDIVFILRRSRGAGKVWIRLLGDLGESMCLSGVISGQRVINVWVVNSSSSLM